MRFLSMSNGGTFVNVIACSAVGDQFAAFAPASGAYYSDYSGVGGCTPVRSPLPMLSIHGGNDRDVPYAGGEGSCGALPPVPDWLSWWAERSDCADREAEDSFGGDVHHSIWTCGDGAEGLLQHWKVDSMGKASLPGTHPVPLKLTSELGHCWASTEINFSQIAAGEGPTHIEASSIIMEFFDQYAKP